jgi:hypothetical protein
MSLAVIYCSVLEREIKALVKEAPEVTHLEPMEWGLHIQPDLLLKTITEKVLDLQGQAKAIMLGYGRCQGIIHRDGIGRQWGRIIKRSPQECK